MLTKSTLKKYLIKIPVMATLIIRKSGNNLQQEKYNGLAE